MLIDNTYFIGEINIPNRTKPAVSEVLDLFIEKYEKELLTAVLGYSLYQEFLTGLQQVTIASKWTDLLRGAEYTVNAKTKKWRGLIESPDAAIVVNTMGTTFITVGGTGTYDPANTAAAVTIPPALVGRDFSFSQRGFGELRPVIDYTVSGNQLTLVNWTFSSDDVYYYKSNTVVANTAVATAKQSLIANYVYYWYMRNQHTDSTAIGEVKTAGENSQPSNAGFKMSRAWNEMYQWVCELYEFLDANKTVYTNYANASPWCTLNRLTPINTFNI